MFKTILAGAGKALLLLFFATLLNSTASAMAVLSPDGVTMRESADNPAPPHPATTLSGDGIAAHPAAAQSDTANPQPAGAATAETSIPVAGGMSARAYAVYDTLSGRFINDGNGDAVLKMASTTKIMTALVALEQFELDRTVTFSREMTAIGSSMYLQYGEQVAVRDLLYGLMLMSGNDAARALASLAEGGEAGFVKLMNAKALSLGLKNTSFANPNGLDADGHHTTARELALVTAEALKNPTFREIVATKSGVFAGRSMTNHNKLLNRVEGCIGVKTGFTSGAGRCLVSATSQGGRDIIVVTLNAPNDWSDHASLHAWSAANYPVTVAIAAQATVCELPAQGGQQASVPLVAAQELSYALSADDQSRATLTVYAPQFAYAPLAQGASLGRACVTLDGNIIAQTDLVTAHSVEQMPPSPMELANKVNDLLETLAWTVGIWYNAR